MKYLKYIAIALIFLGIGYYVAPKMFGARTMNPIWNRADLEVEVSLGSFTDATTTVISVVNPFTATATVDYFLYNQTGAATSTYAMDCGIATALYASPSDLLIDGLAVATSTYTYMVNAETGSGTNSKGHVIVAPTEYISCLVTTTYPGAFTEASNTYDGSYKIRWIK